MFTAFNFRKTVFVIAIFIIGSFTGAAIHHISFSKGHKLALKSVSPTLDKAIEKETTSNVNHNSVNFNRTKKVDTINVNFSPDTKQKAATVVDCPTGSICLAITELTRKQKKKRGLK